MKIKIFKIVALALFAMFVSLSSDIKAQNFKGKFANFDLQVILNINLYNDSIDVPGLEGLETCYGYLSGNINGSWLFLKVIKIDGKKAEVRASNERGNDSDNIKIEFQDENNVIISSKEGLVKYVENNKYVKLPKPLILKRVD